MLNTYLPTLNFFSVTRLIFWIGADLLTFFLSTFLQKSNIGTFYSITDITNNPRKFFEEQKFVNFSKNWFYHDYMEINKEADLEYLKNFENKYSIDIFELAKNDRILIKKYNPYHDFSKNEINSILENECKLFEKVLDEVKPDFFITTETALQPHHLFYEMCKSKGVKILMFNHANWKNFCYISESRHKIDNFEDLSSNHDYNINFENLRELIQQNDLAKSHMKYFKRLRNSKLVLLKTFLNFIFSNNKNIKTHYTYFGRTKLKVFFTELMDVIKTKQRKKFIDSNLINKFHDDKPFLYLPLHQEPERSLLIAAPKFTDQIKTVKEIASNLPKNYELYVKEHPTQGVARGWRDISFYEEIINTPNVKLFHPHFDSKILLEKCKLVVSVGGTSSFEAGFFAKPSIIFADLGYSVIPSIKKLNSYNELKDEITNSLNSSVNPNHILQYVKTLEKNSFVFDFLNFEIDYTSLFYNNGTTVDVNITNKKMETFLFDYKSDLEKLSNEFLKKIQYIRNN